MIDYTQPQAKDLLGRIENGKYESALRYLEGQPLDVVEKVEMLARLFSNSGWVDGDMGSLVHGCVANLIERRLSKIEWRMAEEAVRYYSDAQQTNEDYRNLADLLGRKVDEADVD